MNENKHRHYQLVARAIDYLRQQRRRQPSLQELAEAMHCSPYHLQRVFNEWAGLSPKQFLRFLNKRVALQALQQGGIDDALSVTGLSSGGRLHDLMVSFNAMTPGEIRVGGAGLTLNYGSALSPFGRCAITWCERGIHRLEFIDKDTTEFIRTIRQQLAQVELKQDQKRARTLISTIFEGSLERPLKLWFKASPFQLKVWEALLHSHPGQLFSYQQLAEIVGSPQAARAVGTALANNPVAYLIPCHRVIKSNGDINQYRWGQTRKRAILITELSHAVRDTQ